MSKIRVDCTSRPYNTPRLIAYGADEPVIVRRTCEGHPAGPYDSMGETVFCDGSCR